MRRAVRREVARHADVAVHAGAARGRRVRRGAARRPRQDGGVEDTRLDAGSDGEVSVRLEAELEAVLERVVPEHLRGT